MSDTNQPDKPIDPNSVPPWTETKGRDIDKPYAPHLRFWAKPCSDCGIQRWVQISLSFTTNAQTRCKECSKKIRKMRTTRWK
jgi:DNA-directed RNA polymerase subunit RPC12/RpoP